MAKLTKREIDALKEAVVRDGWGLFKQRTTAKLFSRGLFTIGVHPAYGKTYFITSAGRAALKEAVE